MSFEQKHIDVVMMDVRRFTRLYRKDELPAKIVDYLLENFNPKIDLPEEGAEVSTKVIVPDKIIGLTCEHFGFSLMQMGDKSRKKELVYARHVAMYLLATRSHMSLKSIGNLFGGRDHTTVIHARDTVLSLMANNKYIKQEVRELSKKI